MTEDESWRNVGKQIRKLRKENGLTLKQLADGCDLSSNAISLVERGQVAPTVVTLCKIAHALGVSASSLFREFCATEVVLTRAGESGSGAQVETAFRLLGSGGNLVQPSGKGSSCSIPCKRTEMILCVSGSIETIIDEQTYQLKPGDSLHFSGEAYHRWRNSGQETGVAVMVLIPEGQPPTEENE